MPAARNNISPNRILSTQVGRRRFLAMFGCTRAAPVNKLMKGAYEDTAVV